MVHTRMFMLLLLSSLHCDGVDFLPVSPYWGPGHENLLGRLQELVNTGCSVAC